MPMFHRADQVLIKLDFKNAFNSLRRDVMLKEISDKLPLMYPMAYQMYRNGSILFWGNERLHSCNGVQQGDPCGPAFFCLTIQKLPSSLDSDFKPWYLDDGTLGGSLETVLRDIEKLRRFELFSGLSLNSSKCELSILSDSAAFHEEA